MMISHAPRLALSEDALVLVRHAETAIESAGGILRPVGRLNVRTIGGSTTPVEWTREAAVLRLVSIVESYIDAVYIAQMRAKLVSPQPLIGAVVSRLERTSSRTWNDRHESFEDVLEISLRARAGWQVIDAGIEVRNCLAHGLGQLTAIQRNRTKLPVQVQVLGVTIHSNRMHLSAVTVQKLAGACSDFIRDIDTLLGVSP